MKFRSNRSTVSFLLRSFIVLLALPMLMQAQTLSQQTAASGSVQDQAARVYASKLFPLSTASASRSSNIITITPAQTAISGEQAFTLGLPEDADSSTLKVILNGHDVSDRFRGSTGSVSAADGLSTVKNVLSVVVKTSSGSLASGRWRSMGSSQMSSSLGPATRIASNATNASPAGASARAVTAAVTPPAAAAAPVCDPVNMCPAWLPPSVRFDTLTKGGPQLNQNPWLAVNGIPVGSVNGTATGQYAVAVMNRETLAWTDFEWFSDSHTLNSFLNQYKSTDLVVVGTTSASTGVDSGLDTSAIGGTNFATCKCALPQSYMVIGSGGQTPGTAYENKRAANAFATGSLLEDVNGNYNFQSSDIVEYAIEPQDPNNYNNPSIEFNVPANLSVAGESRIIFQANARAGQNGLWLLILDRTTLFPPFNYTGNPSDPCSDVNPQAGATRVIASCGTFYAVGPGNSNIDGEWNALANVLAAVTSDQIVFLQSIGTVGSSNLATTVESATSNSGFLQFKYHFQPLGGTPLAVAGPNFNNTDNYSFVGYLGAGNALAGGAAELSTAFPGQIGVLHGTLQRDSNGLYRPSQASPEQQGMFNDKGGLSDSDFELSIASYQQPVQWPSNSGTVLLSGASSIAGQQAAYRFISHWLLAGYYIKSIQGPHQDDIHFFFSGSANTSINYQAMDPANLQFPTVGTWSEFGCTKIDGATCTFQAPGDSAPSTFTTADFNAVKAQVSTEVIYLTNTLQYLVTGSTNLKDIVAAGNGNVGLALSAAANTVMGSGMGNLNAEAIAQSDVTFSWQSLLGTIGGIAGVAANLESFGELTPLYDATSPLWESVKEVISGSNAVGSVMSTVGSAGTITSSSALPSAPQPFAQLTTTVGQLATQDLQSPLIIGFDSMADNITSDWGRLSAIGPRTTNTSDSTFFAPNQIQQVAAINAITSASTRNFYFSLLPTVYKLHYWSNVGWVGANSAASGVFQPTVGSYEYHNEGPTCNAFYLNPNTVYPGPLGTLSIYQGITYPSIGGTSGPFTQDPGFYDFWVMDLSPSKPNTQGMNIPVISSDLATNLFSSNQLNTPMLQFYSANGPMESVVSDASVDRISGWSNGEICDASDSSTYGPQSGGSLTSTPAKALTTTSLISSMSGVLGQDAVFTAQVMAGNQPVTSGAVYLSVDGNVIGNPSVGADGTASATVKGGLTLGNHQVTADYAPGAGYEGSSAPPATFIVYSQAADLNLTMASTSINVSYNAASAPVALQVSSIAGLAGNVVLSCTGLPVGLSCSFDSKSLSLTSNGNISTNLRIVPTPTAQASILVVVLPLFALACLRSRSGMKRLMLVIIAAGIAAATVTGCSGGSMNSTPTQETGTKTILVNAGIGSVSRSVAVDLNIQ